MVDDQQRENLKTLAHYLMHGELKYGTRFDMRHYADIDHERGYGFEDCGTVGCAIGHGPYAGIPKLVEETWRDYRTRVFGISAYAVGNTAMSGIYLWCVSDEWYSHDNTPQGAGIRILYMLENGLPDGFRYPLSRWVEHYMNWWRNECDAD